MFRYITRPVPHKGVDEHKVGIDSAKECCARMRENMFDDDVSVDTSSI